jgi:hypothetical protein
MTRSRGLFLVLAGLAFAAAAQAQTVISAKSGLVHYVEGEAFIGDNPVDIRVGEFPELRVGETLRTELGRAEVLLTPGVFLRISENSSVRMVSNRLEDVRLELVAGSVLLEAGEIEKDQSIQVTIGDANIEFRKRGLFRLEAEPERVRTYDGEAVIQAGDQVLTLKGGRETLLGPVLSAEKFDKKSTDAFHRWASRRSSYLAVANMSSARSLYDRSIPWTVNGWYYNPYFGAFTYIPFRGAYRSPFGFAYYSPRTYDQSIYYRSNSSGFGADSGWRGMSNSGGYGGRSGGYSAQVPMSSGGGVSSAPAPAPRAASPGGSREGRGGR